MSYPPARYVRDSGETSAVWRPASARPDLSNPSGTVVHYLATGATTGGDFGLYRWEMGPAPTGPDPHFHRSISESFFVLSGTVRLFDGDSWADAGPGDFLHVPPGGIHGFRNESGQPASMLLLFTPGAPREEYFETLADPARRSALADPEQAAEFYLRHDNHWC